MKYNKTVEAEFVDRPNRFVAHVKIEGKNDIETVHVKNTGRCRELLLPKSRVMLEDCQESQARKTRYDLIAVYKANFGWINIDSQAPNKVVAEWLEGQGFDYIKPEYKYGQSRIDFYMEKDDQKYLLEVKGCTLEMDGIGYFPDAPTVRGTKHLRELTKAVKMGYRCGVAFVIQMEGIHEVRPNMDTDSEFAQAFMDAKAAGVNILFLECKVDKENLMIVSDRYYV